RQSDGPHHCPSGALRFRLRLRGRLPGHRLRLLEAPAPPATHRRQRRGGPPRLEAAAGGLVHLRRRRRGHCSGSPGREDRCMTVDPATLLTFLGMMAVTYAGRIGGYWLVRRYPVGPRLGAGLEAVPLAVLTAIIAPTVLATGPAESLA